MKNLSYESSKGVWCTLRDEEEGRFTDWHIDFIRVLDAAIKRGNFEAQFSIWEEGRDEFVKGKLAAGVLKR
jgi:hypothetical protein